MITLPLSQLLGRGVTLEAVEAVTIVQALASSRGAPSLDNVEIDSAGGVRCRDTRGEPAVPALAALLDRLLPAGRIPAALRYTVARGIGAVEAPPFASVADFSRALVRFEAADRAQVIRALISRARPVAPVPVAPTPPLVHMAPRNRRGVAALSVLAALLVSALAGYVSVDLARSRHADAAQPRTRSGPDVRETGVSPASSAGRTGVRSGSNPVQPAVRRLPPLEPREPAAQTPSSASHQPESSVARMRSVTPSSVEPNAFSPAFSPAGTALFFQTGGAHDPTSAIAVARLDTGPAEDLRIMKVVDDAARNYHARPSPDGRLIAFDSDREGERAVFVADKDGTHVRRVSGDGYAALPSWSPDGRRLAFVRGEPGAPSVWNIWIQPIAGGAPERITHYRYGQTWAASWFPDGRRIAYSHEDELTILDLATSRAERFRTPVRGRLVRTPAVSPDGSRIVFQVYRAGAWMLNVRDRSMECVLADPTAEEFAWAPDGHRFAFHSRRDGEWGVYVLTASPAAP